MSNIHKVPVENGYYLFKLEQLIEERGISKNQMMRDLNTDFKVLQRLFKGTSTRMDITVLARICDYLNVKQEDIVEYFPNKKWHFRQ